MEVKLPIYAQANESENLSEFLPAFHKAQAQIKGAEKKSDNPHFKSDYADLASVWESCQAPLADNGFMVISSVHREEREYFMKVKLLHTSGQWIHNILPILMGRQDMQALGSSITYARRYGLMALVGICPVDDDGNAAVEKGRSEGQRSQAQKPQNNGQKQQGQPKPDPKADSQPDPRPEDKKPAAKSQDPLDGKIRKLFLDVVGMRKGEAAMAKRSEVLKVLGIEDMRDIPAAPEIRKKDWIGQLTQMWEKEEADRQAELIANDAAQYEESALEEYNRERSGI